MVPRLTLADVHTVLSLRKTLGLLLSSMYIEGVKMTFKKGL